MGWNEKILQNAIDSCTSQSGRIEDCPVFSSETELQSETKCTECKMKVPDVIAKEDCAGPMDTLCGGVKVTTTEDDSPIGSDNGNVPAPAEPAKPSPEAPVAPTTTAATEASSRPEAAPPVPDTKPTKVLAGPDDGKGPEISEIAQAGAPAATPVVQAPVPAAPAPTQAPAQPPAAAPVTGPTTIYSTVTEGGSIRVEEIVYVEQTEFVTVTAPAAAPQKYRRNAHAHHMMQHRRDREHGLLGHKY
jgi:hypothetical protein